MVLHFETHPHTCLMEPESRSWTNATLVTSWKRCEDLEDCVNCSLGPCVKLRRTGCSSTPPPSPSPRPSSTAATPTLSLQPLWRPLQLWTFSSCPSSFHPVYPPPIPSPQKRHISASRHDVFTLFFLLPNLRHSLSSY